MAQIVKNLPTMLETKVWSLGWEDPLEKGVSTHSLFPLRIPVCLPGKSHGQKTLAGYSPWGHKESDTTEQLTLHFTSKIKNIATIWPCNPTPGHIPREKHGQKDTCVPMFTATLFYNKGPLRVEWIKNMWYIYIYIYIYIYLCVCVCGIYIYIYNIIHIP